MPKKWIVLPPPPEEFNKRHPELPPIVGRLLWNRHLRTQKQIDEFLNPDYLGDLHDPFLFKDMAKAVAIIFAAIDTDKSITVHGDYDADGVCSAAVLVNALKKLGAKKVGVFIPHREIDGYGLNNNTVNYLKNNGTNLIITCDCGVSNFGEVTLAKELGMQVIITDHHVVPEKLPPADAIIHHLVPGETYPDKGMAGCGVAFKLVQGLLHEHQKTHKTLADGQTHESYEKWQLDLVTLATIGDMVPLFGESRTLVRYGLTVLNKTKNIGIKKLLRVAGVVDENGKAKRGAFDAHTVGFQLVPRLNAAGRMDHANSAFALLTTEDEAEAEKLALQLNKNNTDRQKITEQMVGQARAQIKQTGQENNKIIFVLGEKWPTGILGLVAGKLKDEYYKPVLVMSLVDGEINGSGRSIAEFDVIKTLQKNEQFFSKFGGHPQACGFSLKSPEVLEEFKTVLLKRAEEILAGFELIPQIDIDTEINLEDVDWRLYDLLQKFEPFGQGNEEPKYLASGLTVMEISPVGQDGKHLRLLVKHNTHLVKKTIGFGLGDIHRHPDDWKVNLHPGDKIDMVFKISVNEWNGNRELELSIEDIKKSLPV